MSAIDLVAVLLGIVCLAAVAALAVIVTHFRSAATELEALVARLESEADTANRRVVETGDRIEHELERVDELVVAAERVSARADVLSKITYQAVAKPVINTAAVVKGTSRAARRLRRGNSGAADRQPSGTVPPERGS